MKKIFFDGFIFYLQRYGGINSLYKETFKRLVKYPDFACAVTLPLQNRCADIVQLKKFLFLFPRIRPYRVSDSFWRVFNESCLEEFKPDIFHSTYFTESLRKQRAKTVVTIHDMIHEIFSSEFTLNDEKKLVERKRRLVYDAGAIICVSESTKQDVLQYYNKLDESNLFVIHNACDDFFKERITDDQKALFRNKYRLGSPYILYVGMIKPRYKNFDLLLDTYVSSPRIHTQRDLVVISRDAFTSERAGKIAPLGGRIRKFCNVPFEVMRMFYHCADMLVFPSRYEGFGMPVLEAMACGIPVAASKTPSILEVGNDACLYFSPESQEDLAEKIARLIGDAELRASLIELGYKNLQRFSWDESTEKLSQVYNSIR